MMKTFDQKKSKSTNELNDEQNESFGNLQVNKITMDSSSSKHDDKKEKDNKQSADSELPAKRKAGRPKSAKNAPKKEKNVAIVETPEPKIMELKDLDAVVEEKLRTMLYQYIKDSGVPVHFDILVHQVSRNLGKLKSTDEAHKITLKIVGSKNSKVTRLKNKTGYWDIIRYPVENEKKQTNENPEKTENSEQEKKRKN